MISLLLPLGVKYIPQNLVYCRVLKRQALNVKKAVTDLWQLAFSYQVNPLAAVQPLPSAPHGSGR